MALRRHVDVIDDWAVCVDLTPTPASHPIHQGQLTTQWVHRHGSALQSNARADDDQDAPVQRVPDDLVANALDVDVWASDVQ